MERDIKFFKKHILGSQILFFQRKLHFLKAETDVSFLTNL